jgi:Skp family chaperone for outer membrane proteins
VKKLLFLLLVGGAVAAALSKARRAEAPAPTEGAAPLPQEPGAGDLKATLERIRHRAQEALDAAHEAQEAKVAEMQRKFDEARGKR